MRFGFSSTFIFPHSIKQSIAWFLPIVFFSTKIALKIQFNWFCWLCLEIFQRVYRTFDYPFSCWKFFSLAHSVGRSVFACWFAQVHFAHRLKQWNTHTTVCVGLVFRMLSIKFNALATFHSIYQNRRCESGFRAEGLQTHSIHLPIPHWKMNKLTDKLRFTFYFSTRKLNALAKPHLTEHWTISPEMNKHNSSDCLKEPEAFGFALT